MEDLLRQSGLRPDDAGENWMRDDAMSAVPVTIVCHRESESQPVPRLPQVRNAGRIVVFSDSRNERTVVDTLEAGAHHFFDIAESPRILQARLLAALRARQQPTQGKLEVAPFRFDLGKRRAWREDQPIGLSPKEFDLAYYLFFHRGRTVGNSELMTAVWSLPRTMDTRRIDTAACRLRKKMGLEAPDPHWRLKRLRSEGYKLISPSGIA